MNIIPMDIIFSVHCKSSQSDNYLWLPAMQNEDTVIEQWKLRRTIQYLSSLRGRGTSLVTMIVPAQSQLSRTMKLLTDEYGLSSCIKSSQTRHNVQQALSSAQGRLRLYTQKYITCKMVLFFILVLFMMMNNTVKQRFQCVLNHYIHYNMVYIDVKDIL